MRKIEFIMGMPIVLDPADDDVFSYFREIDERFSPYKQNSEVTMINDGRLKINGVSDDMELILRLCQELKKESDGYFDIYNNGTMDPSGIVKGWAIFKASEILRKKKIKNFYVNAGGDIQTGGLNDKRQKWVVGIRNPFKSHENVKVVYLSGEGIATSGTYERGNHVYNPKGNGVSSESEIVSLTVIGPNVYEADRFSTPAFAMGKDGINFIERKKGLEGYMIDKDGIATMTSEFLKYTHA